MVSMNSLEKRYVFFYGNTELYLLITWVDGLCRMINFKTHVSYQRPLQDPIKQSLIDKEPNDGTRERQASSLSLTIRGLEGDKAFCPEQRVQFLEPAVSGRLHDMTSL